MICQVKLLWALQRYYLVRDNLRAERGINHETSLLRGPDGDNGLYDCIRIRAKS